MTVREILQHIVELRQATVDSLLSLGATVATNEVRSAQVKLAKA